MDVLEELAEVTVPEQREPAEDVDAKYGNVLATYPEGAEVDGLMTVAGFAAELTFKNFENGLRGVEAQVVPNDIYQVIRAKRHPLPVVLVGDKAFIPQEAFQAWAERPTRGEGTGASGSRRSDEDLLKLSAKAREELLKTENRIEALLGRRDKERKRLEKYSAQIFERFGENAWAKVDEWVSANESAEETEE